MIIIKTPFRISFFGGGTDFPKYYNKNQGCVIGTTINKYCYISIRKLENIFNYKYRIVWSKNEIINKPSDSENPIVNASISEINPKKNLEIHFQADLPKNSGLGSSSAFCVGILNGLLKIKGVSLNKKKIAKLAIKIEQKILNEFCGVQDQIWSSYGGMNFITFKKQNKFTVRKLRITKTKKKNLEENLLLMFTEKQRYSKEIEKSKQKDIKNKFIFLDEIKKLTLKSKKILEGNENINKFGELLNQYWALKKKLSNKVSNNYLDKIYNKIIKSGAIGAKLLGSGGGGFFLIYCNKKKQKYLKKKLNKFKFVNFKFSNSGSEIIYSKEN
jgi:D-glycero-alpha-D-manno-heptose-7-phosphate kinase